MGQVTSISRVLSTPLYHRQFISELKSSVSRARHTYVLEYDVDYGDVFETI